MIRAWTTENHAHSMRPLFSTLSHSLMCKKSGVARGIGKGEAITDPPTCSRKQTTLMWL